MTRLLRITPSVLATACALALGFTAAPAGAQSTSDAGYVTGTQGVATRSGYGLCWRSGSRPDEASIAQCEPAVVPAPIALVPAPAPVAEPEPVVAPVAAAEPVPAAPLVVIERVTLDADALFDFDRSELRAVGKYALDQFAGKMKEMNPEMIMAIGHADRIGSAAYNQHLSEQRVEAVKGYLVGLGIAPDRVHTEGRGETEPVTTPGQCDGAASAKVIACLQPDRRVVVEVMGERKAK